MIHVQHINTREGATFFIPGTYGAKIHPEVVSADGEYWVVKQAPNSFFQANLLDMILKNSITNVVVCGMVSHMCIDTTVRAAKDFGIGGHSAEDTCATKD